ncbi:type II toxin-antitoxin system mRNA interferase toxin, RelE/StbE family [Candidatus Micrarchaeota archaeon]|nr:type II toxin-antitoxin system mRNA interferase toxin, RelE/StbE family [Candidatus Micrarchaeota archaeon]
MAYEVKWTGQFKKSMKKLKKKDGVLFNRVKNKAKEIAENPERFKHLRNVLAGFSRIHFGSFVLIFKIEGNTVKFISLDHHDYAY